MSAKVFIDGEHGTTGLQIRERLAKRDDITVISLAHEDRHDANKREEMLGQCDIAILCLPDDAARESVAMIEQTGNDTCKIIDTSTAHRTHLDWEYGFAELDVDQRTKIANTNRVSNPGCYSTGAIALLKPLVTNGIMAADFPVTINAISGYTGGGKQLIAQIEDENHEAHNASSHFLYALPLQHKHVPEIMTRSGLSKRPIFTPAVGRFPQGMLVSIPLHLDQLNVDFEIIQSALADYYADAQFVSVADKAEASNANDIKPEDYANRDDMKLWVLGDADTGHANLVAQLDNLGKGASGAAVQNLDIMLGQISQHIAKLDTRPLVRANA